MVLARKCALLGWNAWCYYVYLYYVRLGFVQASNVTIQSDGTTCTVAFETVAEINANVLDALMMGGGCIS
jgi:hypothetical protein